MEEERQDKREKARAAALHFETAQHAVVASRSGSGDQNRSRKLICLGPCIFLFPLKAGKFLFASEVLEFNCDLPSRDNNIELFAICDILCVSKKDG